MSKDIAENESSIRDLIAQPAAEGARLVNFCEGALPCYPEAQIATPEDWLNISWQSHATEREAIPEARHVEIYRLEQIENDMADTEFANAV